MPYIGSGHIFTSGERPDHRKSYCDPTGWTHMNHREEFPPPFHLGPWMVHPDLNRISGEGADNSVEPRVMLVLLCLANSPGEVWSRQALLDEVWGESEVGEEILTRAISELRRIFGDKARDPRFIETIRNHGYRLIETPQLVQKTDLEDKPQVMAEPGPNVDGMSQNPLNSGGPTVESKIIPEPISTPKEPLSKVFPLKTILVSLVALVVLVFIGYTVRDLFVPRGDEANAQRGFATAKPWTSFPGREWHPAFSADGTRVAFVWSDPDAPGASGPNIYVKQQNSETLLKLTNSPGWVAWPTWSPDGQTVAFVQGESVNGTLSLVSSLGGAVRPLHTVLSWVEGLDFAPDGKSLLFAAQDAAQGVAQNNDQDNQSGKYGIYQLNLQDLQVQKLSLDDGQRIGDFQPKFSPDGQSIAWIGVGISGHSSLYWASLSAGSVQKVGGDLANVQGLAFAADGDHLIYSASPAGVFNLWRIALPDGGGLSGNGTSQQPPEWLPTPGAFAWNPGVARQSGDLVFEQVLVDQDIWQIQILKKDPWQLETSAFMQSTRWEYEACFSPDGQEVGFISARSGSAELWLADKEGKNLRQLTHLGCAGLTNLRWSPDGSNLAFNALKEGRSVVMVVATRGGEPRSLTPQGKGELFSSWSHDGGSLLFGSIQDNGWQLQRRNLKDGQTRLVTHIPVVTAVESPDGQFLYFTRPNHPGLWVQSLNEQGQISADQEAELILEGLSNQDAQNWVLGKGEIFWVLRTAGVPMLAVTDLASGRVSLLTELSGMTGNGLAVSSDGAFILYPRTGEMEGDLMVLQSLK